MAYNLCSAGTTFEGTFPKFLGDPTSERNFEYGGKLVLFGIGGTEFCLGFYGIGASEPNQRVAHDAGPFFETDEWRGRLEIGCLATLIGERNNERVCYILAAVLHRGGERIAPECALFWMLHIGIKRAI